jgi:hypothetical protein
MNLRTDKHMPFLAGNVAILFVTATMVWPPNVPGVVGIAAISLFSFNFVYWLGARYARRRTHRGEAGRKL